MKVCLNNTLLTPVAQRLLLYRFALVEIQPESVVNPVSWGLPYLQAVPSRGGWEQMLGECLPFTALGGSPVISASLGALRALRQRQPGRPMILARPAFASPLSRALLCSFVRKALPAAKMTALDDGIHPLRWLKEGTAFDVGVLKPYQSFATHPLSRLLIAYRITNPSSTFTYREDGLLEEQAWLFAKLRPRPHDPSLQAEIQRLELALRASLLELDGSFYVFAEDRKRLTWFRRDVLRLMPKRYRCHDYPTRPDAREPGVHFILVHDGQVKLRNLTPLPALHLDGNQRALQYRSVRLKQGTLTWLAAPSECSARYPTEDGLLRFYRTDTGWSSYAGGEELGDGSEAFALRAQVHQILCQTRLFG